MLIDATIFQVHINAVVIGRYESHQGNHASQSCSSTSDVFVLFHPKDTLSFTQSAHEKISTPVAMIKLKSSEILLLNHQNGYNKKRQLQVLASMRRNQNPHTLPVEL